jgi:hypothetical protein
MGSAGMDTNGRLCEYGDKEKALLVWIYINESLFKDGYKLMGLLVLIQKSGSARMNTKWVALPLCVQMADSAGMDTNG